MLAQFAPHPGINLVIASGDQMALESKNCGSGQLGAALMLVHLASGPGREPR